eukprot:scaffold36650_cov96-Phaeocystis_antarctica.AAC.1
MHRQRSRKHLRPGVWSPGSLRREAARREATRAARGLKIPLRCVRFLRPAWPDCSLLSVTRLNGVPAQGESPAPPWCQKRAGNGGEPCDEVCRNRAGRVSSRCNSSRSSHALTCDGSGATVRCRARQ